MGESVLLNRKMILWSMERRRNWISPEKRCTTCGGTGRLRRLPMPHTVYMSCPDCGGTGRQY